MYNSASQKAPDDSLSWRTLCGSSSKKTGSPSLGEIQGPLFSHLVHHNTWKCLVIKFLGVRKMSTDVWEMCITSPSTSNPSPGYLVNVGNGRLNYQKISPNHSPGDFFNVNISKLLVTLLRIMYQYFVMFPSELWVFKKHHMQLRLRFTLPLSSKTTILQLCTPWAFMSYTFNTSACIINNLRYLEIYIPVFLQISFSTPHYGFLTFLL